MCGLLEVEDVGVTAISEALNCLLSRDSAVENWDAIIRLQN